MFALFQAEAEDSFKSSNETFAKFAAVIRFMAFRLKGFLKYLVVMDG